MAKCTCGQLVNTGQKEWNCLTLAERRAYLLPTGDIVMMSFFLAFTMYLAYEMSSVKFGTITLLALLGLYALVLFSKWVCIRKSLQRTG
jgi:hypothetical protein